MVKRPAGIGAFEFAVLSALRACQLTRGCTPRVEGAHKLAVTAQLEVAERKVENANLADLATPARLP
jgi:DNA-directed RNA polymerase subunit K/omega